jgi:hypothetical protein
MWCYCADDIDRFREVIAAAIAASEVQSYAAFTKVRLPLTAYLLLHQCGLLVDFVLCSAVYVAYFQNEDTVSKHVSLELAL